jgi:hypothetical protein
MPHKSNFFFPNVPIWLALCQKKVQTIKTHKNRRLHGKMKCLPLWPSYIGEKGRTLGKTYGIKARCYWEHPWGTHWEPGNILRTWSNQLRIEHELLFKWLKIVLLHKFIFLSSSPQSLSILELATLINCIFCNCYNNGSFLKPVIKFFYH